MDVLVSSHEKHCVRFRNIVIESAEPAYGLRYRSRARRIRYRNIIEMSTVKGVKPTPGLHDVPVIEVDSEPLDGSAGLVGIALIRSKKGLIDVC
jgi:hypothetical protein